MFHTCSCCSCWGCCSCCSSRGGRRCVWELRLVEKIKIILYISLILLLKFEEVNTLSGHIKDILYLPHCHNNYKMFHKWPILHDNCHSHRFLPLHRIEQHHLLYKPTSSKFHIRLLHQYPHHTTHHYMEKHHYRYCSRWILSISK